MPNRSAVVASVGSATARFGGAPKACDGAGTALKSCADAAPAPIALTASVAKRTALATFIIPPSATMPFGLVLLTVTHQPSGRGTPCVHRRAAHAPNVSQPRSGRQLALQSPAGQPGINGAA